MQPSRGDEADVGSVEVHLLGGGGHGRRKIPEDMACPEDGRRAGASGRRALQLPGSEMAELDLGARRQLGEHTRVREQSQGAVHDKSTCRAVAGPHSSSTVGRKGTSKQSVPSLQQSGFSAGNNRQAGTLQEVNPGRGSTHGRRHSGAYSTQHGTAGCMRGIVPRGSGNVGEGVARRLK